MTSTYYTRLHSYNTLRIHLSRDLLLLDILIFVEFIKEIILCVALWNAEGTCRNEKKCNHAAGPAMQDTMDRIGFGE